MESSNAAFEILLREEFLGDKSILFNTNSAWCTRLDRAPGAVTTVKEGENDWCYVSGLPWMKRDPRWPLLANAFAPGTAAYVDDPRLKGGCWRGVEAMVIWAGGNGEVVDTRKAGNLYFVPRPDKPALNAFEKDGDWLAGDEVKVLYPLPPK